MRGGRSPMSTAIIVLGGHRSGTSCAAGILHHLGVPVGEKLLGANTGNPAGHFEDVEFLRLHKRILGEDSDVAAWRHPTPEFNAYRDEYRALIDRRNRDHALW